MEIMVILALFEIVLKIGFLYVFLNCLFERRSIPSLCCGLRHTSDIFYLRMHISLKARD